MRIFRIKETFASLLEGMYSYRSHCRVVEGLICICQLRFSLTRDITSRRWKNMKEEFVVSFCFTSCSILYLFLHRIKPIHMSFYG